MKHLYGLSLILTWIAFSAKAENNEKGFTITEIIIKDSVPAKELLNRATYWAQKKNIQNTTNKTL